MRRDLKLSTITYNNIFKVVHNYFRKHDPNLVIRCIALTENNVYDDNHTIGRKFFFGPSMVKQKLKIHSFPDCLHNGKFPFDTSMKRNKREVGMQ